MADHNNQTRKRLLANAFGNGFAIPPVIIAVFVLMTLRGIALLPDGYDGSNGLNDSLLFLLMLWALGMVVRAVEPGSRLASCLTALILFCLISFTGALAAAANAIGGGDYIDPWLVDIDAALFPFYDWKAVAIALPNYDWAYWALNKIYNSLSWQPLLFIFATAFLGYLRDLSAFLTAWGLGLLLCVLPFHWLPALSPMNYYNIAREDLPLHQTDLPWRFLPVIEGIRDGSTRAIGLDNLTGMVTVPSFHACGATILAWAFWRYKRVRYPFLVLNISMALAAVPIGSHYIIDIVIGVGVGLLAAFGATQFNLGSVKSGSNWYPNQGSPEPA